MQPIIHNGELCYYFTNASSFSLRSPYDLFNMVRALYHIEAHLQFLRSLFHGPEEKNKPVIQKQLITDGYALIKNKKNTTTTTESRATTSRSKGTISDKEDTHMHKVLELTVKERMKLDDYYVLLEEEYMVTKPSYSFVQGQMQKRQPRCPLCG
eukprot:GEZU01022457.1.p2 GENE.GEZU01022457.1~~GEZU01022457.1.p2  ORF type:complete len:154 (+),score=21.80 GEZU01022457.1:683-1144(+)